MTRRSSTFDPNPRSQPTALSVSVFLYPRSTRAYIHCIYMTGLSSTLDLNLRSKPDTLSVSVYLFPRSTRALTLRLYTLYIYYRSILNGLGVKIATHGRDMGFGDKGCRAATSLFKDRVPTAEVVLGTTGERLLVLRGVPVTLTLCCLRPR